MPIIPWQKWFYIAIPSTWWKIYSLWLTNWIYRQRKWYVPYYFIIMLIYYIYYKELLLSPSTSLAHRQLYIPSHSFVSFLPISMDYGPPLLVEAVSYWLCLFVSFMTFFLLASMISFLSTWLWLMLEDWGKAWISTWQAGRNALQRAEPGWGVVGVRIGVTGKSWCLEVPVMMARVSNRLNSGRCAVGRGPDLAGGLRPGWFLILKSPQDCTYSGWASLCSSCTLLPAWGLASRARVDSHSQD